MKYMRESTSTLSFTKRERVERDTRVEFLVLETANTETIRLTGIKAVRL